ncbi:MAG: murein L,D-transpeptidase catalytic domain family protein [Flavobacteriaceae bacterium]|nr:murein L,D-transpeptidase catalytic domain family protein [Flavobacteriaceae bacterium]
MNYKSIAILLLIVATSCKEEPKKNMYAVVSTPKEKDYTKEINHITSFAKQNNYNTDIALMIDYSLHSGFNRFFVVDLKTKTILSKGLVCHGSC